MATIREYIGRDLRDRLRSGTAAPSDLTLNALARHYRVSLTPVREALRDLVNEGALVKEEGGRVRRGATRARREPTMAPPRSPSEIEAALATEVIARSLRGDTDYLREEATAARFGVGRTVVRQVFSRLAGRGLLVHVPRCGFRVRPFDEDDLDAYLELREVLELKALDLARDRLDAAELKRMLAGNVPGVRRPRLDNDLHVYFVEKADNAYIGDFFERHGAYYTSVFDFAAPETCLVSEMAEQHRAILEALIARDWPKARAALSRHIRAQRPIVKALLRRIGQSEPRGA
jgi:DNA-binding GntR family transcriptional regulator